MGKFDGMLLVSDFDNTLLFTKGAMETGKMPEEMSPRNMEGIRYWMAEGGVFAVATGRATMNFRKFYSMVPTNAPTIVDNGGAIYDYTTETYRELLLLPDSILERMALVSEKFPNATIEMYHKDDLLQIFNPCDWSYNRAKLAGVTFQEVSRICADTTVLPITKVMLASSDTKMLEEIRSFMTESGWRADYEITSSAEVLIEITAKGATKGETVRKLQKMMGCSKVFCVGDQTNDLPMLTIADRAFAPANAAEAVLSSDVTAVCHSRDGAIGDIVEILSKEN